MSIALGRGHHSDWRRGLTIAALSAVLVACTFSPSRPTAHAPSLPRPSDPLTIPDAVPKHEPLSARGNMPFYTVYGQRYYTLRTSRGYAERGIASWYGPDFHGKLTSNGEVYDMNAMTAAHKTLPLPSYVQVTNLRNGRRIVVRINDRGPFHDNRVIDLSYAAALKLDLVGPGTGPVEVRAIQPGDAPAPAIRAQPGDPSMYLQVGAFGNRANAEQLQARLRDLAGSVKILETPSSPNRLYRVRIGPLARIEDVDLISAKVSSLGIKPHVVVE